MEVKAKAKHIRMSPRKVRLVASLVRGMEVNKAIDQLNFTNKWAKKPIKKLIESAIANAEHNFELDKNNLYIKEIKVDEGATLKRWMPRAHGRATTLRKRMSHIDLTLAEIKDSGKKEAKKQKIEDPVRLGEQPKEEETKKDDNATKKETKTGADKEQGKEIVDPRNEGRGGNTKIEGKGGKGFANKIFRRKSG